MFNMFLPFLLSIAIAGIKADLGHNEHLDIAEDGSLFSEGVSDFYSADGVLSQTIHVPQHNQVNGMTQYNDFKLDISIYRTDKFPSEKDNGQEKLCYVTDMTAEEKKLYKDFEISLQIMNSGLPVVKPKTYVRETTNFFVTGNESDIPVERLAVATQHCGTNRIVPAIKVATGADVSKFANDRIKAAGVSYDIQIRDIYTCDDAARQYAMSEMMKCGGVMNDFRAICRIETSKCAYILSCPYEQRYHYWLCKGKHNFHNNICCNYECTMPAGK